MTGAINEVRIAGFTKREYESRHLAIRERMQMRDIDCLIITGNESWFGAGNADVLYVWGEASFGLGPFIVFPLEGEARAVGAHGEGDGEAVIPGYPVSFKKGKGEGRRLRDYAGGIARYVQELGLERGTIAVADMRVMPADVHAELQEALPLARFVPAGNLLLECRRVKSEQELEYVRRAGEVADLAIEAVIAAARPGVTERELINLAEHTMIDAGARRGNFAMLSAAPWEEREAGQRVGSRPSRALQAGDLILDEFAPSVNGYSVQLVVPILVGGGELPASAMELLALHEELYRLTAGLLRPGRTIAEIERQVAERAAPAGDFSRVWALQVDELAESFYRVNYTHLAPGMTWVNHPWTEPQRGKPGLIGHFLGNTFIVTDADPECTSKIPIGLVRT
jgi:Xaa-Pro aminopeptidase